MAITKPNANFHSLAGASVHDSASPEYIEYRRKWEENPRNHVLGDFPLDLDIESTSRCNLRCTFCDKLPLLQKGQKGDIDFALFTKIIDEGAEHRLCAVKLSYRGEPLMHPRISEMVYYAKKHNVLDVYFNTNGMLLTETAARKLIDAGLNRLSVSIEGVEADHYEKHRVGAKFNVVKKNLETMLNLKKKLNVTYPKIRIQSVQSLIMDQAQYISYWKPFCDEVATVEYNDESNRRKGLQYDWACPQLWQRMAIEWDGTILPCNNDDIRTLSPGNAKTMSIGAAWTDAKISAARELHKKGRSHEVEDCDGCPWRTTQILKLMK